MHRKIAFILALPLLMVGCGGSGSPKVAASSGSVTGNWQMSLQQSDSTLKPRTQSGFLVQSNNAVSGSLLFSDKYCSGVGNAQGTVSGTAVSLTVDPTGLAVNLTGTLGSTPGSMSGSYTILSTGCSGPNISPESGTWTGSLVSPLKGNILGTIITAKTSATVYNVTGQVSQGPNTGISSAPLSGSLTFTGYCFASVNVMGVISGTSVVMDLLNAAGNQIGQINATSTTDGTSLTGTYNILPQGSTSVAPCIDGDRGAVTFTL